MVTGFKLSKDGESILYYVQVNYWQFIICNSYKTICNAGYRFGFHIPINPKRNTCGCSKKDSQIYKRYYGLWYPKSNNFTLREFTDADWEGSIDDRKSTSGAAFYLGDFLVSWLSKKKSSISLSIAEAEYIDVASCCTQVIWMKQTLGDL